MSEENEALENTSRMEASDMLEDAELKEHQGEEMQEENTKGDPDGYLNGELEEYLKENEEKEDKEVCADAELGIEEEVLKTMYDETEDPLSSDLNFDKVDEEEHKRVIKEQQNNVLNKVSAARATISEDTDYDLNATGLQSAGKRQKRKIYGDSDIIPLKDRLQVDTEAKRRHKEYLELVESQRTGKIITGNVCGMDVIAGHVVALVQYGHFTIMIPSERFLELTEEDRNYLKENPDRVEERMRLLINQRILSEVDFIIRRVDEVDMKAIGDRVAAMRSIRNIWYFTKHGNNEFALNEGDRVEARIVYTTTIFLVVEVYGMEYRLRPKDISYTRIANVGAEYSIGDTVIVKFTRLKREKRDDKHWGLAAKVSIKEAVEDTRKIVYDSIKIGQISAATVTGIEEHGIYARLQQGNNKLDVLIKFTRKEDIKNLPVGRRILVRITEKVLEDYRIYGVFVRAVGQ